MVYCDSNPKKQMAHYLGAVNWAEVLLNIHMFK